MVQDPVCGMSVDESKPNASATYHGKTHSFCSMECKQLFEKEPQRYLTQGDRPKVEEQHQPRN